MTLKRVLWTVGLLGLIPLVWALFVRFFTHPDATDLGSVVPWGLHVSLYIFFVGVSAGSFLLSSLVYVFGVKRFDPVGRLAVLTAIVTLLLGLLTIGLDIGHIERFWHVFVFVNPASPMAWMIWLYTFYLGLLFVELWFLMRRDLVEASSTSGWKGRVSRILSLGSRSTTEEAAQRDARVVRITATIGVPVAVMFHGGVGALFGVVAARPFWHSGMYPVMFLVSALVSGGALLVLLSVIFQGGWRAHRQMIVDLGKIVLWLLLLDTALLFSEILIGAYGSDPAYLESLDLVLAGPYWYIFWILQGLIGVVVPVIILISPWRSDPRAVTLACGAVVMGFIGVRLNIVIPGLSPEEIRGITEAVTDQRIRSDYFPTSWEWLLSLGIICLGIVLFLIADSLLPLGRRVDPPAPQQA